MIFPMKAPRRIPLVDCETEVNMHDDDPIRIPLDKEDDGMPTP